MSVRFGLRGAAIGIVVQASVLCGAVAAGSLRVQIDARRVATLTEDQELYLEAFPDASEGLAAFAQRHCGSAAAADQVVAANGGVRRLLRGVRYRVPFSCLRPDGRDTVISSLFPDDRPAAEGWRHQVGQRSGGAVETLWSIARWFTGSGESYRAIRDFNRLADETIVPGQTLTIPAALLRSELRSLVEGVAAREPALRYGRDGRGSYAAYLLRAGEALYSSVVVRFTGRLFASDVNPLADEIARRSDIADVTDIPVGFEVKIPLEYLSPEFLPNDHPGRIEYEQSRSAMRQFTNEVTAAGLEGVTVILDAGHGGKDSGAQTQGVWESLYVYDIMLRTKALLEQATRATVFATTRDGDRFEIEERDRLSPSQGHAVLTTPPYGIVTAVVGTHLRWYLSNDILATQERRGAEPQRVVFLSIHADSLHPSVRGAMVYVPGLLPIPTSYGKTEAEFTSRKEVRNRPRVSFTSSQRIESEGLSRDLANHLVEGFRGVGLAIHPNQPVRDRIVRRGGRPWVPAVLRYSAVPSKVLIEVCNLSNPEDLRLIQTREFRDRVALAIVDGLLGYYGQARSQPSQVAATGD